MDREIETPERSKARSKGRRSTKPHPGNLPSVDVLWSVALGCQSRFVARKYATRRHQDIGLLRVRPAPGAVGGYKI